MKLFTSRNTFRQTTVISSLAALLAVLVLASGPAQAEVVEGKVAFISGSNVEAYVDPSVTPRVADSVLIVRILPEIGDEALVASGYVTSVKAGQALSLLAKPINRVNIRLESASSRVRLGDKVRIAPRTPARENQAAIIGGDTPQAGSAWFGFRTRPVTSLIAAKVGLKESKGELVQGVLPGSPADTAGLKRGDVLLQLNGTGLTRKVFVPDLLNTRIGGEKLDVVLLRDGETKRVTVTSVATPPSDFVKTTIDKLAEEGVAWAQSRRGIRYMEGRGVNPDSAEALKWLQRAAKQGYEEAETRLAEMYLLGEGVERDFTEGRKWCYKAALNGNVGAQYIMGLLCFHGHGVKKDQQKAAGWFRLAAKDEHALAQYFLGLLYKNGWGVTRDDKQAVAWFHKGALQELPEAQNSLGLMIKEGRGVKRDDKIAHAWIRRAVLQGNATAQNNLGLMHLNGRGVPKDRVEAIAWFLQAEAGGDETAKQNLKGMGIPR